MPSCPPWKWLFVSVEHLTAKDRWVAFSLGSANRWEKFVPSPVAADLVWIYREAVRFFAEARAWGDPLLWWGMSLCLTLSSEYAAPARGLDFIVCVALWTAQKRDEDLKAGARKQELTWKESKSLSNLWDSAWYCENHIQSVRNSSWPRHKAIKVLSGLHRRTYFNPWNFGLRENVGGLLKFLEFELKKNCWKQ